MKKLLLHILLPIAALIGSFAAVQAQDYGSEMPESTTIGSTIPTEPADMSNYNELEPVTVTTTENYGSGYSESYTSIASAISWDAATSTGSYNVDDLPWAADAVTVTDYIDPSTGDLVFEYSLPIPEEYDSVFTLLNHYYFDSSSTPPAPAVFKDSLPPCDSLKKTEKITDSIFKYSSFQRRLDSLAPKLDTLSKEHFFDTYQKWDYASQDNSDNNNFVFVGDSSSLISTNNLTNRSYSSVGCPTNKLRQVAFTHTHPKVVDNSIGLSFPSVTDVYSLIKKTSFFKDSCTTHASGFIDYVLAADGEKFAIKVTNDSMALQFYKTMSKNLDTVKASWADSTTIKDDYQNAFFYYSKQYHAIDSITHAIDTLETNLANEMAMAAVLNDDSTGITVMKSDSTGSFKALTNRINKSAGLPEDQKYVDPGCAVAAIKPKEE